MTFVAPSGAPFTLFKPHCLCNSGEHAEGLMRLLWVVRECYVTPRATGKIPRTAHTPLHANPSSLLPHTIRVKGREAHVPRIHTSLQSFAPTETSAMHLYTRSLPYVFLAYLSQSNTCARNSLTRLKGFAVKSRISCNLCRFDQS